MSIDTIGLNHLIIPMFHASKDSVLETWVSPGINPAIWGTAIAATGLVALDKTEQPYQKAVLTGTVNADTARLYAQRQWSVGPTVWGDNTVWKRFVMMWEAKFVTVASIENTTFLMGLSPTLVATRATNETIGFVLTADVLNSLTDNAGTETVNAVGAPVLTNWHTYAIEAYQGGIVFYVDGAAIVTHSTNLPDYNFYPTFYLPQEAAANGGELHIGQVALWHEPVMR